MNTTQHSAKPSQISRAIGSTLVAAALLLNMGMAQAADTMANESAKAVYKTERVMSDSWITTKVKSEILANNLSKAYKLSVKTKYGMVSLKGTLPSQDAVNQVKMTAEKVKGVKSVDVSGLMIAS